MLNQQFIHCLLSIVCLSTTVFSARGQRSELQASVAERLWPDLALQLDQDAQDTARYFILEKIHDACQGDYKCLHDTYYDLMVNMEEHFDMNRAVFLGEALLRLTIAEKALDDQAEAHLNLSRYFDAMDLHRQSVEHLDQAAMLYQQTGNQKALLNVRLGMVLRRAGLQSADSLIQDLENLMAQAVAAGDTNNIVLLHIRLGEFKMLAERYAEVLPHVEVVEKAAARNPVMARQWGLPIQTALSRAELARLAGRREEAADYLRQAVDFAREGKSKWLEIRALQLSAELANQRGRVEEAKAFFREGLAKADSLELHEFSTAMSDTMAYIAESEGRPGLALDYTRKARAHARETRSRQQNFNLEKYYLEKEKDLLAAENAARKTWINRYLILLAVATVLLFLLLAAYLVQRRIRATLKKQNAMINDYAVELKRLSESRARFFINISHELRTPLTLLVGPLKSLSEESHPSPRHRQSLQLAVWAVNQLQALVHEILDFRKMEVGKITPEEEATALFAFFLADLSPFQSLANQQGLAYEMEIDLLPDAVAWVDRKKIRHIVQNFLSNAFKFTPSGGKVTVGVAVREQFIHISVADTGPGIHPDDLPHVFDRFYQSEKQEPHPSGGSGIGLSMCQEYAVLLGGEVGVKSALGAGSVFTARLPFKPADVAPAPVVEELASWLPAPGVAEEGVENGRPLVLVIEDNAGLQQYLRILLSPEYRVEMAANGREALAYLDTAGRLPDLVLSDLMMPEMDGFALLDALRSRGLIRRFPVLLLTARTEVESRMRAFRLGIDDYLTKPFTPEELLVRMDNALRNFRSREEWRELEGEGAEPAETDAWSIQLEACVRKHMANLHFNVEELAVLMGMSRKALYRQIRERTGLSANQYIQEVRLLSARDKIESGEAGNLGDLAAAVGFRTANYLSRLYRERFGKSPVT